MSSVRHVETIFAAFYKSLPVVKLRIECLRTKNEGAVALDWELGDETEIPFDSLVFILLVISLVPYFHFDVYIGSGNTMVIVPDTSIIPFRPGTMHLWADI